MDGNTKQLQISTGIKTYDLNGKVELSFNPSDAFYIEGVYKAFEELDKKQEAYKAEVEKAQKREIFDIARRWDAEMREMVDNALGTPVCDALFGRMNVYALADGLPLWANLLLSIMDEMDAGVAAERQKTDARIAKYTKKYHK